MTRAQSGLAIAAIVIGIIASGLLLGCCLHLLLLLQGEEPRGPDADRRHPK